MSLVVWEGKAQGASLAPRPIVRDRRMLHLCDIIVRRFS
jgi:hypothetical protein